MKDTRRGASWHLYLLLALLNITQLILVLVVCPV